MFYKIGHRCQHILVNCFTCTSPWRSSLTVEGYLPNAPGQRESALAASGHFLEDASGRISPAPDCPDRPRRFSLENGRECSGADGGLHRGLHRRRGVPERRDLVRQKVCRRRHVEVGRFRKDARRKACTRG